jgi:hypothetical protein
MKIRVKLKIALALKSTRDGWGMASAAIAARRLHNSFSRF